MEDIKGDEVSPLFDPVTVNIVSGHGTNVSIIFRTRREIDTEPVSSTKPFS